IPPHPVCRGTARCTHWRIQNEWAAAAEMENEQEMAENLAISFAGSMAEVGGSVKAVNLPAWRKVAIDMEHVLSGHVEGGSRVSSMKSLWPYNMSPKGIERAIRTAFRYGTKVAVYGDRVKIRGQAGRLTIEMWYDRATKQIRSAY